MNYDKLVEYTKAGFSIRRISKKESKGYSTVRYWLGKYNLTTRRSSTTKYIPNCDGCGEEIKNYNKSKKYCNNKCQGIHQWRVKKKKILEGEKTTPRLLKRALLEEKDHACWKCGIKDWNDRPAPLELEHIDGNSSNNDFKNLEILCCNCHAQTPTYKGKNKGNGRYSRRQRYEEGKSY